MIHSGSRHLGFEVAQYYQTLAHQRNNEAGLNLPFVSSYVEEDLFLKYMHDLQIVQTYASLNRRCMANEIIKGMKLKVLDCFDTVHNYIEQDSGTYMLRKGAISSKKGETLLIPINMKDGAFLCIGKGNSNWNFSAPHGSGRIKNRQEASNEHTVSEFKKEMKGIFCSVIGKETLDEAPFAYRRKADIKDKLSDTVEIIDTLQTIYNFKSEH